MWTTKFGIVSVFSGDQILVFNYSTIKTATHKYLIRLFANKKFYFSRGKSIENFSLSITASLKNFGR